MDRVIRGQHTDLEESSGTGEGDGGVGKASGGGNEVTAEGAADAGHHQGAAVPGGAPVVCDSSEHGGGDRAGLGSGFASGCFLGSGAVARAGGAADAAGKKLQRSSRRAAWEDFYSGDQSQ